MVIKIKRTTFILHFHFPFLAIFFLFSSLDEFWVPLILLPDKKSSSSHPFFFYHHHHRSSAFCLPFSSSQQLHHPFPLSSSCSIDITSSLSSLHRHHLSSSSSLPAAISSLRATITNIDPSSLAAALFLPLMLQLLLLLR